jgi:hypothetical protein
VSVLGAEDGKGMSAIQERLLISQAVVGLQQLIDSAAPGSQVGEQASAERGRLPLGDPHEPKRGSCHLGRLVVTAGIVGGCQWGYLQLWEVRGAGREPL